MAERGTIHRPGWWYLCVEPVHLCVFLRQKQAMDAQALGPVRQLLHQGQAEQVVLCGERHALALQVRPAGWWRELRARWRPADARALLDRL